MSDAWRRFDDGVLDLLRGQKRQQAIDVAVRIWLPKSLVDDCRKTGESVTFIDANLYFPIRAEFRRIMDG